MVGMLMRNENRIDVGKLFSNGTQCSFDRPTAHTGINQNAGIADTYQGTVALGAGKQRNDTVNGGFQNNFLS